MQLLGIILFTHIINSGKMLVIISFKSITVLIDHYIVKYYMTPMEECSTRYLNLN